MSVSIVIPVHEPKFGFCRAFLNSLAEFKIDADSFLVFGSTKEACEFGQTSAHKIVVKHIRYDPVLCRQIDSYPYAMTPKDGIKKFYALNELHGVRRSGTNF